MTEPYTSIHLVLDFCIIGILILGIWLFRRPERAKSGNLIAASALACAAALVLFRNGTLYPGVILVFISSGAFAGYRVAGKITMLQIPAMVAFQNGAGGMAACCLSLVELIRGGGHLGQMNEISGLLGLTTGALTFSGSMIAGAKLLNLMTQTPVQLSKHTWLVTINLICIAALIPGAMYAHQGPLTFICLLIMALSMVFGVLFSIRIGGADMPVLISFLNAMTGAAAALCGMIIENKLLIGCGAMVAASGTILTHVMCRAMNRSLSGIFIPAEPSPVQAAQAGRKIKPESVAEGNTIKADNVSDKNEIETKVISEKRKFKAEDIPEEKKIKAEDIEDVTEKKKSKREDMPEEEESKAEDVPEKMENQAEKDHEEKDHLQKAAALAQKAEKIIIIPGYGMAVAQAQFKVVELSGLLESMGKKVKFAIHPVAGRMPGHMNVLLAEADVDYDLLYEMDEINSEFRETDLVFVVGACDVVNPSAIEVEGSPISGMPILMAGDAKNTIIFNYDTQPGYSGVENPLYNHSDTLLILGDAAETVKEFIDALKKP
ncbi:MAG: NAD(P)(+) transhydrogenase (Re/Si-specific) subunit beta [Thermodesulfobacteriota bacterium]|nr:NAD(P)(+) transhydrogenase (Re/Si-specific) subunit beta [Thermodesulfobacteriota bacterium]